MRQLTKKKRFVTNIKCMREFLEYISLGSQRGMTVNEPDVRGIVEADFVQLCQKKDTYRSNGNQAQPAPTNDAAAEGGKKSGK